MDYKKEINKLLAEVEVVLGPTYKEYFKNLDRNAELEEVYQTMLAKKNIIYLQKGIRVQ